MPLFPRPIKAPPASRSVYPHDTEISTVVIPVPRPLRNGVCASITPEASPARAGVAKAKGFGSHQTFLEGARLAGGTKTRRAAPCLREGQSPLVLSNWIGEGNSE
jgi:hypothetical protein